MDTETTKTIKILYPVNLRQAELLRTIGFNLKSLSYYTSEDAPDGTAWLCPGTTFMNYNSGIRGVCSAPDLSTVHRWLRDVKQIYIPIDVINTPDGKIAYKYRYITMRGALVRWDVDECANYPTYEDALSAGIDYALMQIIEQDTQETK